MNDAELEQLSVKELGTLKDRIDLAIRAVIRASRAPNPGDPVPEMEPTKVTVMDLERERDAWLSAKR